MNRSDLTAGSNPDSGLRDIIPRVPTKPGVYLMRNSDGEIIYVGKALNLKKRLSSYLKLPGRSGVKTDMLIKKIADLFSR